MMKKAFQFFAVFAMLLCMGIVSFAADRLGIAKPIGKNGVTADEIEAVWTALELSVDGGYIVVPRSSLETMLSNVKLNDKTGLSDLTDAQKAELAKIKDVRFFLVSAIGKIGSRINFSMELLDPVTGQINPNRRTSVTVKSMDELADKLKDMLGNIGLCKKANTLGRSALLSVFVTFSPAPAFLSTNFNALMETYLLAGGMRLQNLKSIDDILRRNNIGSLSAVDPSTYVRIGELLQVDYLILPMVTRFSCTVYKRTVQSTGQTVEQNVGDIEGSVRIIDTHTGEVVANFPFANKIDFSDIEYGEHWQNADYGKYIVNSIIPPLTKAILDRMKGIQ